MMTDIAAEVYDLLILVDATGSMSAYLQSLRESLPQIISLASLTNCFENIGLLAYRDYTYPKDTLDWSGWAKVGTEEEHAQIIEKARNLYPQGNSDYQEASKTGFACAYEVMRQDAKTLIFWYGDAPPHMKWELGITCDNGRLEQKTLLDGNSFGGYGPLFADWCSMAHTLREGSKRAQVMSVIDAHHSDVDKGYYEYLSTMTDGMTLQPGRSAGSREISQITIELLLAWMGVKKPGANDVNLSCRISRYADVDDLASIDTCEKEENDATARYFRNSRGARPPNFIREIASSSILEQRIIKKKTPLQDFAKVYQLDPAYRHLVTTQLRQVIEIDVVAMTLNPVFGSLWRAFCGDRLNTDRSELLALFDTKVNLITDADRRAQMRKWVQESYDYTADVLEAIDAVPERSHYPCVFLDPTLAFEKPAQDCEEEDTRPITSFSRDELLELGRSCDARILRRLGRVLTRLTVVHTAAEMPVHIARSKMADVPRIPLALVRPAYGRRFWRILLHVVVAGTMLSERIAATLAALVLRMGIQPLMDSAETEMILRREKWNTLDIPELWNSNTLSLLVDADSVYRERRRMIDNMKLSDGEDGLLFARDRDLFQRLIDYRLLELNLTTTLHATVTWAPEKATMPIGPLILCSKCFYSRSVTVMADSVMDNNICGFCYFVRENKYLAEEEGKVHSQLHTRVTQKDNEQINACWVECGMQDCHAQYVVYNVNDLNVKPKCFYCRHGRKAPVMECKKCLSRMIWPEQYRPKSLQVEFLCMGCKAGRETRVVAETNAQQLKEENGLGWLLLNKGKKVREPFNGKKLFPLVSSVGSLDDFCERVQLFPGLTFPETLTLNLHGKKVQNAEAVLEELQSWVSRRRAEMGTCSLCFEEKLKNSLLLACGGRSGCKQRICRQCIRRYYGLNAPGRIINTSALNCPFCKRAPLAKTMAAHGLGIHAVGNLREAVETSGEWIYAWCVHCAHAKQYVERVCEAGAPQEIQNFACESCLDGTANSEALKKTKPCPGCGIQTEKSTGCDHMQCPCGTHWCYFCGEKQDEKTIYAHMSNEHGGYYQGLDYDVDDDGAFLGDYF